MQKPKNHMEKILLTIAVLVLLINIFSLNSRLTNLENAINNEAQRNTNTMFEMLGIRHSLSHITNRIDSVSDEIIQSTRASFNEAVTVTGYDTSTSSAQVEISFFLREHNIANSVYVTARGQVGQTHTAAASFINGSAI